ncbi:FKBP-type peptidyl-prolyl cis-trans isomerase [Chitinophaga horti]|uniref:Peptidyl-prolyl cis-trans isomerase n=1 Tax=Chitinophaga horti TaxID=2920382 RepID=A0ABY6J3J6_9BACT|nr:FKBP-type peptidyl-prolyl cis-trans isomerase [Chitinophaga horti]UYQ94233.1 FKBP-type peptidyl-prolyl cis-trans isomerase [Chitinophaga horti]
MTALCACTKEETSQSQDGIVRAQEEDAIFETYFRLNNIDSVLRDPSGLMFRVHRTGGPETMKGSSVPTVIFTTKLVTGKIVQSSLGVPSMLDGRPLNQHIPGWQIGLSRIGKGGKMTLYIPSALAYGPAGISNVIPANAPLISEIELVDFKD